MHLVHTGEKTKAISLLSDCLNQLKVRYGEKHKLTITAATTLGSVYLKTGGTQIAVGVFSRAWEAVKDLPADDPPHTHVFRFYMRALSKARDEVSDDQAAVQNIHRLFDDAMGHALFRGHTGV